MKIDFPWFLLYRETSCLLYFEVTKQILLFLGIVCSLRKKYCDTVVNLSFLLTVYFCC